MKVLKIAAIVVTAAVLISTGIGMAGGASLLTSLGYAATGIAAATGISGSVLVGILAVTAALDLSMLAGLVTGGKPSSGGSQTKWKADPYAGIPYVMGRTLVSGNIVAKLLKTNNAFMGMATILSLGPIAGYEASYMNKTTMEWSRDPLNSDVAGEATNGYRAYVWEHRSLGACPETYAVGQNEGYDGWGAQNKLSGLAAVFNSFCYNSKASDTLTSVPSPAWLVHGVLVYDPRLDSTYPGGSGPCRALDESTYVWSENPHLHALTWCLGRWQEGIRVAGIGAPLASIDMPTFVEGANLDDARGWTIGGQVYTRPDTPWNSLKTMLQAGGAAPAFPGGIITSINRAPRVSLDTITHRDIVGKCTFAGTQPRRTRINGIIPQYRSEANDWELVSAQAVIVSSYVALDGDERTKEVSYPLVQDVHQVSQLATYDICDAREAGPGSIVLKPGWLNYKLGDCLLFQPEEGWSVKVMITGRSLDAGTGAVTYTVRTETDAKHAFALGQTGIAPPTAGLTYNSDVAAPTTDWTCTGTVLTASDGSTVPAVVLTGAVTNASADSVIVEYRPYVSLETDEDGWITVGTDSPTVTRKNITSVTGGAEYQASVRYTVRGKIGDRAIFGPVTAGALAINGGTLLDGSVDTPQLAPGSVTGSVRVLSASVFTGTGAYQTIGSMAVNLATGAQVDIYANAAQGYASGARGWGLRLVVDGVVTKEFGYGSRSALTDILTMQRSGITLDAGAHTITLDWVGQDSTIHTDSIDLSAIRRSA